MINWLSPLLLVSALTQPEPSPASLPEQTFVAWPHEAAGARIRVAGLTLITPVGPVTIATAGTATPAIAGWLVFGSNRREPLRSHLKVWRAFSVRSRSAP